MPTGPRTIPRMLPAAAAAEAPTKLSAGLPSPLTRLIGRDESLAELERLLAASRLLTLTGTGGSGKTRLAMELARRAAEAGVAVTWVDLACLADPALVSSRIATALGIREAPGRSAEEALLEMLCEQRRLLVLDNCEHLVEAVAEIVETMLAACGRLVLLATSREALRVSGERAWLVPALATPASEADLAPEALAACGAVQLFAERAAEASRSFALTRDNAAAVVRVCRRLDGLPLAIELAAARAGVLGVEQIADRLDDAFRLLGTGPRRAVPRHRTLRAAIDWSYSLLAQSERRLLARLAVFAGGFSLEAAEAVGADEELPGSTILDLLAALVGKSLVRVDDARGAPRYHLLETVRQYARERLHEAGAAEEDRTRRRHAEHFLTLARELEPRLMSDDLPTLDRLGAERDNVRAALAWSREAGRDEEIGLPLAAAFHWYWYYAIQWSEGARWLEGVLAATDPSARTAARAAALRGAGAFAWYLGDPGRGLALLAESESICRELGERRLLSFTLAMTAQALVDRGELDAALERARESAALARESQWGWDLPYSLTNGLAFVHQHRGELEASHALFDEAQAAFRRLGHRHGLTFALGAQACLNFHAGQLERTADYAHQALASAADPLEPWFAARALRGLGYHELGAGRAARAAWLLGGSEGLLRSIGARMMPFEQADYERALARLGELLPAEELAAALAEGRSASFARILEVVRAAPAADVAGPAVSEPRVGEPQGDGGADTGGEAGTAAADGPLHVRALGPLELVLGDRLLTGASWGAARAKELLFLLLCHPRGRTKEQIGMALWPDASPGQVHNSFHVTVHRLRRALGDAGWIVMEGDRYRLDPRRTVELDALRFEPELESALAEVDETEGGRGLERLESALALHRGPLFDGEAVGDWHLELRDRLESRFAAGLAALAAAHERAGRLREAAETWRKLLAADEVHEQACRGLMRCLAQLGERAAALRAYRDLASRLWDELATEPAPETTELFERLQAGGRG